MEQLTLIFLLRINENEINGLSLMFQISFITE